MASENLESLAKRISRRTGHRVVSIEKDAILFSTFWVDVNYYGGYELSVQRADGRQSFYLAVTSINDLVNLIKDHVPA